MVRYKSQFYTLENYYENMYCDGSVVKYCNKNAENPRSRGYIFKNNFPRSLYVAQGLRLRNRVSLRRRENGKIRFKEGEDLPLTIYIQHTRSYVMNKICYLDNAATSFPKPTSVIREVSNCLSSYCGNAGRGAHKLSLYAATKIYECRELICALVNAPTPENIVFVPSCTFGLNLIAKGVLKQGDHVILSDMEHNAVLRPLAKLKSNGIISYDTFPALSNPHQSVDQLLEGICSRIKKNTKLVICTHQSNVCSYSLPLEKIGALCKENHILFAVDCAQSAGHLPIDMQKMGINFLAAPAHKGLYGLQGGAFVAINSPTLLDTLIEGGNGINSLDLNMGEIIPERYEAGTLPLPSIVGLTEGIKFLNSRSLNNIRAHERDLFCRARDGLLNINGATVYAPEFEGSTLLFNLKDINAQRVCALLDENNVCVRSGFHCAPLAHKSLGTDKTGAVRISFGVFNNKHDIDNLLSVINKF